MSLMLTFLFEDTNWSLGSDFTYNSNIKLFICVSFYITSLGNFKLRDESRHSGVKG